MATATWLAIGAGLGGTVAVSYLMEALRRRPKPPESLVWGPGLPISHVTVQGARLRYIKTGTGPPLVLLHTLRTQLDIFQKVIPRLAQDFTVYALDLPGHGWSDIPEGDYGPDFFARYVGGFLDALELKGVLVAGVSIGASVSLLLAAKGHPGVGAIVAINPYDYGRRGITRANWVARVFFTLAPLPVLGGTVMRLRNRLVEGKILEGGVADPDAIPGAFKEEVFRVGERPGHHQAFLTLIRNMPLWRGTHAAYSDVRVPVQLVYGDHDWSHELERLTTAREIGGATPVVVQHGGHFLPLDQPESVIHEIRSFASEMSRQSNGR
ncbi:MAG TPA: alpha/beta hydrolase [Gemmatimonadales bacterium]|nr:alpha/beta hydrolase [Gemmatimonadales bacterium]